ncbi:MAG: hypothetical protein JNJ48_04365 [Phycisphaerae bacterium]|nr:hypothetical protein [Phycisphaerae bacterium]
MSGWALGPLRRVRPARPFTADSGPWSRALEQTRLDSWRLLKRQDRRTVHAGTLLGRAVVVKSVRLDRRRDRLRLALGLLPLRRQCRGARRLERAGLPVSRVLAICDARCEQGPIALAVFEAIDGPTLLHAWAEGRPSVDRAHALARAAGWLVRRIAGAGLRYRDCKPSNLILAAPACSDALPTLVIIDPDGVRRGGSADRPAMLASLWLEPTGVGRRPSRSMAVCACRAAADGGEWKALFRKAAEIVAAHGDPTPRVNPLAPTEA